MCQNSPQDIPHQNEPPKQDGWTPHLPDQLSPKYTNAMNTIPQDEKKNETATSQEYSPPDSPDASQAARSKQRNFT